MSIISPHLARTLAPSLPLLVNGERMTQAEFHSRYRAYPEDVKVELIGGVVYMASPLGLEHSDYDDEIGFLLGLYRRATPGVQVLHNATTILGKESEPQPDLGLRILPECGGQSRTTGQRFVDGAPELVVEIAHSARAIDLHDKREDYRRAGVVEYFVLCVEEQQVHWSHFPTGRPVRPDRQGVARSRIFPGLWVDVPALLRRDSDRTRAVLEEGLASRPHAAFVRRLAAARRKRP
jgi:Uma2 family endonuclease